MKILSRLVLKDYLLFKNLDWSFPQSGCSVIRGINLDGKKSRNAVGKSLLAYSIATIINGEPPFSTGRGGAKNIMDKNSKASLSFLANDERWTVDHVLSTGGRYHFTKNGKALNVKDVAQQKRLLEKLFPVTSDVFYSVFYVSSYRPSVLWLGTPAQRHSYFENIFDLHVYDDIYKQLSKQRYDLDAKEKTLAENKLKYEENSTRLDSIPRDVESRLRKLKARHSSLSEKIELWSNTQKKLAVYIAISEQIKFNSNHEKLVSRIKTVEAKIGELRALRDEAIRNKALANAAAEAIERKKALIEELRALEQNPVKKISLDYDTEKAKLREIDDSLSTIEKYRRHIDLYNTYFKKFGKPQHFPDDKMDKLKSELAELDYRYRNLRGLDDLQKCPCCGQSLDKKVIIDDISKLETARKALSATITRRSIEQKAFKILKRLEPIIHLDAEKLLARKRKIEADLKHYADYSEYIEQKESLEYVIKSVVVKKVIESNINSDEVDAKLSDLERLHNAISNEISLLEKLDDIDVKIDNVDEARDVEKRLTLRISESSRMVIKTGEMLSDLSAIVGEKTILEKDLREIETAIDGLEKQVGDKYIIDVLCSAYSSKGIRILQVQTLADTFVNLANDAASLLFSSPYKFSCDVAWNKFPITVERNGRVSDVRFLSGSESRKFMALSALVMYQMIPDKMRFNTIIMDELESGQSQEDRVLFSTNFIPHVLEIVPHVMLITPMSKEEFSIEGANEFVVTKKNNVSTLRSV